MTYSDNPKMNTSKGAVFAAIVSDEHGQRVFYVGEVNEAAAKRAFGVARPDIPANTVTYRPVDEGVADALGVTPGSVRLWEVGAAVRYDLQSGRVVW